MVVFSKCLSAKLSSGETYLMTESRDPPTDTVTFTTYLSYIHTVPTK